MAPTSLVNFPQNFRPYNNITPFTYRDGVTYLEVLEGLKSWITDTLVPHLDTEYLALSDTWQVEVVDLITTVNDALVAQGVDVTERLAILSTEFSDLYTAIINNSVIVQDSVIGASLTDVNSASRTSLNDIIASAISGDIGRESAATAAAIAGDTAREAAAINASITARMKPNAKLSFGSHVGANYELVTVRTAGVNTQKLLKRYYAYDYETAGTTGSNFKPGVENLTALYARTGKTIILNDSGYNVSSEVDSIQIKDGVIYHDFMPPGTARGVDCLGFRADGSSKMYSSNRGDTAVSVLADGVVNTLAFGPAYVIDGVKQTLTGTELSARQIFGVTATGDLLIVSVMGKTGVSGITYPEAATLAHTLGCVNAIALDGGGSVQVMLNGHASHNSSDTAPRPVPAFLTIDANVIGEIGTSWDSLPLANDFTAHTYPPEVRKLNGVVSVRGAVINATATTATKAATMPYWCKPVVYQRFPATLSAAFAYYDVNTLGEVELSTSIAIGGPRYLSCIRYNN